MHASDIKPIRVKYDSTMFEGYAWPIQWRIQGGRRRR